MLKDMEFPIAVPLEGESSTSTADALRAQVRKLRRKTWTFEHLPDLVVNFSKPLEVTLQRRFYCGEWLWGLLFGSASQSATFWVVCIQIGDFKQEIYFNAEGGSDDAIKLMNEIEEAKEKYERAVRDLKAFLDASHMA